MSLSRRKFLKGLATTSAVSVIGPSLLGSVAKAAEEVTSPYSADGVWKVTGSHWGAFRAKIYNGQVTEVEPLPRDKYLRKCSKGSKALFTARPVCVIPWCDSIG